MAQNNQEINEEEEQQYVEHQLQDWYRQGVMKGENIQKLMEHKRAPYGEEWGLDPELWDETGKWGCDERVLLPIEGPVHWSHVWNTGQSAGKDHEENPLPNEALIQSQLDYLTTHPSHIVWGSELGGGSFGVVWEVLIDHTVRISTGPMGQGHWDTQRVLKACKVIRFNYNPMLQMEERVKKLLNDYNVIEGLNHENVVKYDDYIPIPDSVTQFPFSAVLLIMDLCDESLKSAINRAVTKTLEPVCCQAWFKQTATGLQYLHQNRVAHLDIKPDNILLKFLSNGLTLNDFFYHPLVPNSFLFKLGDFGLSVKFDANQPMTTRVAGNMYCLAPELLMGVPVQVIPYDVFSLGTTLYEALFGWLVTDPRFNIHNSKFITRVPEMVQLVEAILSDNPTDRPSLQQILSSNWLQF